MTSATASYQLNQGGWGPAALTGGVSAVALQIRGEVRRLFSDAVRTATGQKYLVALRAALQDSYAEALALAECGEADAPSPAALREADSLLDALPSWAATPTPTIEPSGAIALEWDLGPNRFLVFAVKGTGIIEHSAILGLGNECWGTRNFAGTLGGRELSLLSELMQLKA